MDKRVFSIVEFGRYRGWPARRGSAMRIRAASRNWPAAVGLVSQPTAASQPDRNITFMFGLFPKLRNN